MTANTQILNDLDAALAAKRKADAQAEADATPRTEVRTYADGSQRVGTPPFPEQSPLEDQAEEKRRVTPMNVPQGMKQSGEVAPAAAPGADLDALRQRAEEQLTSDVISGKDPHTPNPTTASDKPQLAGESGVVTADQLEGSAATVGAEPTAAELEAIAAQIEPKGEATASDEQKTAAVAQVARETKGPVATAATTATKKR